MKNCNKLIVINTYKSKLKVSSIYRSKLIKKYITQNILNIQNIQKNLTNLFKKFVYTFVYTVRFKMWRKNLIFHQFIKRSEKNQIFAKLKCFKMKINLLFSSACLFRCLEIF